MRLSNGLGNGFIELVNLDEERAHHPGVELEVRLVTDQINARFDRPVCVGGTELYAFVEQLRVLDEGHRSEAILSGMVPDEFTLRVRPADPTGHLAVMVCMRHAWAAKDRPDCEVSIEFEIDRKALPGIVNDFAELRN